MCQGTCQSTMKGGGTVRNPKFQDVLRDIPSLLCIMTVETFLRSPVLSTRITLGYSRGNIVPSVPAADLKVFTDCGTLSRRCRTYCKVVTQTCPNLGLVTKLAKREPQDHHGPKTEPPPLPFPNARHCPEAAPIRNSDDIRQERRDQSDVNICQLNRLTNTLARHPFTAPGGSRSSGMPYWRRLRSGLGRIQTAVESRGSISRHLVK